jgi:hypothetical protein
MYDIFLDFNSPYECLVTHSAEQDLSQTFFGSRNILRMFNVESIFTKKDGITGDCVITPIALGAQT